MIERYDLDRNVAQLARDFRRSHRRTSSAWSKPPGSGFFICGVRDSFMIHLPLMILCALLVLLTLPGTVELALVTFAGILPPSDRGRKRSATKIAKLAIAIPAHDEAGAIVRCVRSIAACAVPDLLEIQIVVVADNCTDVTADLARSSGARVLVRSDPARRGKGFALKFAFETLLSDGFDAFMVVDADSIVDSNFLTESVRLFRAGADGVQARYVVLNSDASPRTRLMNVAFMAFNVLRARGRQRLGLSAGICGNGFGLSRSYAWKQCPYKRNRWSRISTITSGWSRQVEGSPSPTVPAFWRDAD